MRAATAGLLSLMVASGFLWPADSVFGADSTEPAESESPIVVDSPKYADFVWQARQAGLRRRPDSAPARSSAAQPAASGGSPSEPVL